MKGKTRKLVIILLACVFIASAGMIIYLQAQYRLGQETYDEAQTLSGAPAAQESAAPAAAAEETPFADSLRGLDLSKLRQVNGDVLGWIIIPGTNISYPLVYSSQKSPTYYLSHTWDAEYGYVGSIFLEPENSPDFSDFNTVIYGHNMRNGSMFGTLRYYMKADWLAAHPDIYIITDKGAAKYEVFAAYEVSTKGLTYQIGFASDQEKQTYLDFCTSHSTVDSGVTPGTGEGIITLSTCTGNGHVNRWVVQAVCRDKTD